MESSFQLVWKVFICIYSPNKTKLHTTAPACIENDKCEWDNLSPYNIILTRESMAENPDFPFCVHLAPHLVEEEEEQRGSFFWFSVKVPYTRLCFGSSNQSVSYEHLNPATLKRNRFSRSENAGINGIIQVYAFKMKLVLSIHYVAKKIFRLGGGEFEFQLSSIQLKMEPWLTTFESIIAAQTHRLICLVQIMKRNEENKQMSQHNIYLGRAQQIIEEEEDEKDKRVYKWKSPPEETSCFPNIPVKTLNFWELHQKQHFEMLQLRIFNEPLSARFKKKNNHVYMPDNEMYSNSLYALPIYMTKTEMLSIKFYNLNMMPNQGIDVSLNWKDFRQEEEECKRWIYKGFYLRLKYKSTTEMVEIYSIIAEIENYHTTLKFLDHGIYPLIIKSI